MDYVTLTTNKTKKKELMGVNTQSGLGYSSLSMGVREQRILKILKTIHSVDTYSLILIDEIDILLHTTALKRLIEKVYDIALKRKLQIIFTTHSLEILKLQQFVDVKYIQQTEEKTMVYDYINNDMIYHMSNNVTKEINIYVEDILAKSIIRNIVREIGVIGSVDIIEIGSITNAFLVASSFILRKEDYSNVMVVLDGDRYVTKEEKVIIKETPVIKTEIKEVIITGNKYCDNCGEKIFDTDKYCKTCGRYQENRKSGMNPLIKSIINVLEIVILILVIYFSLNMLFEYKEKIDPNFKSPFKISMTK